MANAPKYARTTHSLNVMINPTIHADLAELAKTQGRSIGELMREAIIAILDKYKSGNKFEKLDVAQIVGREIERHENYLKQEVKVEHEHWTRCGPDCACGGK